MLNFRDHLQAVEEAHRHQTPVHGIGLPQVERTGRVEHVNRYTDPIQIHLSGGTKAFLAPDDLRRLGREPRVGDTMTLTFLRNPGYQGREESQIIRAVIH